MPIPLDTAAKLRTATRDAAFAFIEDLEYIRKLTAESVPSRGDIRRLSCVLRRLLIDDNGDLRKIAPCRTGRVELLAPDLKPYIKAVPNYFIDCCGVIISAWPVGQRPKVDVPSGKPMELLLSQDGFLAQPVMCFRGLWIRRGSIIKYVANIASGVHSKVPVTIEDHAIALAKTSLTRKIVNGQPTIAMGNSMFIAEPPPLRKYDATHWIRRTLFLLRLLS